MTDAQFWRQMYGNEREAREAAEQRVLDEVKRNGRLSWAVDQLLSIVDRYEGLRSSDEVAIEAVHRDLARDGWARYIPGTDAHQNWHSPYKP